MDNFVATTQPLLYVARVRIVMRHATYTCTIVILNNAAVNAIPAMRYLTSIFGLNDTTFSYGEFAEAMTNMGFFEDVEAGMLVPYAHLVQPFAYNPAGLDRTTIVSRDVQDAWRDYMRSNYGWNMVRAESGSPAGN